MAHRVGSTTGSTRGRAARRVLFAFAGGLGHLAPMLPIADVLRGAGHRIGVCGDADVLAGTQGFDAYFPEGDTTSASGRSIGTLAPPDLDHEYSVIGTHFAGVLASRRFDLVREVVDRWHPDLLICDEMDFGAMTAAEHAAVPRVVVDVIASGALVRIDRIREPLRRLRAAHDLPSDHECSFLSQDLVISPFPPSFRDPDVPLPATAVSTGPGSSPAPHGHLAVDWLRGGKEPHRVYVTLGTVFNTESGDLFVRLLRGLHRLPARVLVTVGRDVDPATLPSPGGNVRIERFVPQSAVLPHVDVVVNHGGSGSVIGALAHGVPVVALPMGADQELNARRLVALRAGTRVDPVTATSAEIGRITLDALSSGSLRPGAERLRDEIARLPLPESVLALLEDSMFRSRLR
ncbi:MULTISPECIES: glycosyltransferase [Rhodococcus]|uniref:glycosyltransferase n=1 Tax=Rhodococcus TaxID=1827 RepID=UPI001E4AAF0D|nr:glycosyltransferase [Rhodococcus pyridinivorans]MCD2119551.1 glycosyltransferase [Rhodococcus pyridinivorans]MCZ4627674.1 glycosyltransferase [Rhodococcus pyridinivorans]MCZ4648721.1 glycosyltransferase [Rhodococcus pyridinivorans]MDJ0481427.1 glycosyltransferase [Rhodococcus pyridinivorans]MDV7254991.1 glycosyltransferase [Rhodococcus pyridinivorans]